MTELSMRSSACWLPGSAASALRDSVHLSRLLDESAPTGWAAGLLDAESARMVCSCDSISASLSSWPSWTRSNS